jgi:ketosteroid isomerase-like protein
MGCGSACDEREHEETFCKDMYKNFTTGNVKGIIDAATPTAFMEMTEDKVPYKGKYTGAEDLKKFFEEIGKAWGGEKGVAIEFKPHDFKVEAAGKVVNKVSIIQLTPNGQVILGTETHTWTGVDPENKKWGSLTVTDAGFHGKAFGGEANQAELLTHVSWQLFGEGKTDVIIKDTMTKDCKFSLFQDDAEASAKVPYAGVYTLEDMKKPFDAMQKNWKMDQTFSFKPTEFKADGNTVTMTAEIDCVTTTGKPIKGTETHVAECALDENGCIKVKTWTVTGGAHHYSAFA